MTPWDEVRRESLEMPAVARRPSPLPWLLLLTSITLTIVVVFFTRARLEDEKVRTAAALKADDELHAKLKVLDAERQQLKDDLEAQEASRAALSRQVIGLELQNQQLQDELKRAKR